GLIRMLSEESRLQLAFPRALGPLGGGFMKDRIVGQVPTFLGSEIEDISLCSGKVKISLRSGDRSQTPLTLDHVIFATGYRVDIGRLGFLAPAIASRILLAGTGPQLSKHYESSVTGLHFIGPAAANSFGPVCRFVYGAYHPARNLARYLIGTLGH